MQALRHALRRRWVAALALAALAGCGQIEFSGQSTRAERIAISQYQMVPAGRAWIYVPDGLLTLERDLGDIREQRIALPNDTSFAGDNFLLLRTRNSNPLSGGRLKLKNFIDETGGLPSPFESARQGQMQTSEDALGTYFFTTKTMGPGVICVLAVRPIRSSARMLPGKADAVDALLRNCSPDGQQAALAPIMAGTMAQAAGVAANGEATALHTMSPFAAPQAGGS